MSLTKVKRTNYLYRRIISSGADNVEYCPRFEGVAPDILFNRHHDCKVAQLC
jgi:hypothetical protein